MEPRRSGTSAAHKCNQFDFVAKNKFGLNSTSTKSIQLPSSNVILVILLAKAIVNW